MYLKSSNVRVVGVVVFMLLHVRRAYKELSDNDDGKNNSYHSEWIGHGTTEGSSAGWAHLTVSVSAVRHPRQEYW